MEKIIARERLVRWNENLKIFHEKKQSQKNFDRAREILLYIGYTPLLIHPLLYYPPPIISPSYIILPAFVIYTTLGSRRLCLFCNTATYMTTSRIVPLRNTTASKFIRGLKSHTHPQQTNLKKSTSCIACKNPAHIFVS